MPMVEDAPTRVEPERRLDEDEAVLVRMREVVREQGESPALNALRAETRDRILAFDDGGGGFFRGYGWG